MSIVENQPKRTPEEEYLTKHKPLSPSDTYKAQKEASLARQKYSEDIVEIEKNLLNYLNTEDPLVDPGTGNLLAWIRHIPYAELVGLSPKNISSGDMEKIKAGDHELLMEKGKEAEGQDFIFELMERLISKPSHEKSWWKEHATLPFIELFQARFVEIFFRMEEQIGFF